MSVSGGGGLLSSPVGDVEECTSLSYEAAVPVGASSAPSCYKVSVSVLISRNDRKVKLQVPRASSLFLGTS